MNQPDLFDGQDFLPDPSAELTTLARRLPENVRFGTSTWTYEGWEGHVYKREYAKSTFSQECLGEYC